jgi:hypothetical protein
MNRKVVMVGVLACTLTGCMHTTFITGAPRSSVKASGMNHFFLWGLANTSEVDVAAECPSGAAKWTVYKSFGDGFLSFITLGIYTPRSWEIDCASSGGPATEVLP